MSRRHKAEKREVLPDAKFGDERVTKFINAVMTRGKKATAEHIVYGAFDLIESNKGNLQRSSVRDSDSSDSDESGAGESSSDSQSSGQLSVVQLFHDAVENVSPHLEVRSRRIGGATYQVPMEVRGERAQTLAFRWLISAARGRNEKTMTQRLSAELLDAANNRGQAIKRREDTHKMAEANRAFAHYRW